MKMDLFEEAIDFFRRYRANNDEQRSIVSEIVARLKDAKRTAASVEALNDELLATNQELAELNGNFRNLTDEDIIGWLHERAKDEPELAVWIEERGGKIQVADRVITKMANFDLAVGDDDESEYAGKVRRLHSETEALYNNMWVIKERLNRLPAFTTFNPSGVRSVRNHLIVHTDRPDSQAHILSVGVHTNGPVLRPIRPSDAPAPTDEGLYGNIEQFLKRLLVIASKQQPYNVDSKS